ncbi:MAG TPA: DUF87 domain-containing protein, partial [Chloroflexota bacterium]
MRIAIERIEPVDCRPEVLEIVAPRTNTAAITAAENFFSGLALGAPFCLEIAATETARWFQLRTLEPVARRLVQEHLQVAYPQSRLRQVDAEYQPGADPAAVAPEGRAAACVLTLQEPEYLPLRTFGDLDLGERAGSQADPMLGILSALGTVPPGGRAISQLVLRAAPVNWSRPYLRMGVEHALASERSLAAAQAAASTSDSSGSVTALAVGMVALSAVGAWRYGFIAIDWHHALKYGPLALGGGAGLLALSRWLHPARPIYDQEQVRDKISRVGFRTELRLAVSGPADISQGDLDACLDRIVAAYGVFGLASGNRFARRRLKLNGRDLRKPGFFGRAKKVPVLNARELAGLWHLPLAQAEVPLLERTGARRILPLPETVARGCRIGLSNHQGRAFPVCLSEAVLRRHLLVIAKTGRGKSALLARLALFVLETLSAGGKQPALILIDPHRDLAYLTLGSMPAHRLSSAVFLDAANEDRPFGLNLVDAGLGWDRDQMTMMVLQIFRREFSQAWGFRMEAAFRYGLHTLFEANQAICRADPRNGRQRQYTILDLPPLLMDQKFRASVLKLVSDPETRGWWIEVFQRLNHSFQTEVVFPVQTKIFRFAGIQAARRIVGQPCSTIDPLSWVKSGAAVIVNTAAGIIGRDAAALVGDLLLNMVTLTIAQQAAVEREERARATVIVDEIHLMPGADYETLLSEMAKYGANLVLATQSLARLDALDREQDRALRPTIFSNIDGLAVFNTSGEDARYLELELGETINRHDILALAEHECYLRLPNGRDGSSVLCSVQLDPPPQPNVETQRLIAAASAMAYGRDAAAVDRDLLAGLNRIEQTHWTPGERAQAGQQSGTGAPKD